MTINDHLMPSGKMTDIHIIFIIPCCLTFVTRALLGCLRLTEVFSPVRFLFQLLIVGLRDEVN